MAPKKRKSTGSASKQLADERPVTRSRTLPARQAAAEAEAAEALDFLQAPAFEAHVQVPSLYRLSASDPCRARWQPVREEGEASAFAGSFQNPFLAIDFNDRSGIWQKQNSLSKSLGEDPAKECRQRLTESSPWTPAGLRNLGATCYLNSLLQYLFFNLDFRYSFLRAASGSKVVSALQQVFALLAEGESHVVDTQAFVAAARVDAMEQADATEFSALLMDFLQRELNSGSEGGGDFIPALFEGEISQVLSCTQDPTHTSELRERFLELRAQLSPVAAALEAKEADAASAATATASTDSGGRKSAARPKAKKAAKMPLPTVRLEQLLQETAFPDEVLDGSNQYHCPRCDRKVDARRTTKLSKLPPYLHVTVERYHYDLQKGERRRLAHPVSFPRRLKLCLGGPPLPPPAADVNPGLSVPAVREGVEVEAALPVAYECVGYLEHVSDSAHSGHYRATLLREDEEQNLAALAKAYDSADKEVAKGCPEEKASEAEAPPQKRAKVCCDGADAAAGSPRRRGSWWRLDDESITQVTWDAATAGQEGEGGKSPAPLPPERIESSTAYLVLYRRCDHEPGQLCCGRRAAGTGEPKAPPLPDSLASYVESHNRELRRRRQEFESNSKAVEWFSQERRKAIDCLATALRKEAKTLASRSAADFCFVPTAWLDKFLRGEDKTAADLLQRNASVVPPVYGRAFLRGRTSEFAIDPLAIWAGEVKLIPTAALAEVGEVGSAHCGLDESIFLPAEGALSEEACKAIWTVFRIWCREHRQICRMVEHAKLTSTEAKALDGQESAWVSARLHNHWKKVASQVTGSGPALLRSQWRAFLEEVRGCRFNSSMSSEGCSSSADAAGDKEAAKEPEGEEDKDGLLEEGASAVRCEALSPVAAELTVLDGLCCSHFLVCRSRAATLVRRTELTALMEVAAEKERAYRELWPEAPPAARPRLRSGLANGRLLGVNDVCPECRAGDALTVASAKAAVEAKTAGRRQILVKRRFSGGKTVRKQGIVSFPVGTVITAAAVKAAVQDQLKMPVSRLWLPETENELKADEVLNDSLEMIIVEKDEAEREGAAFNNSVFLQPSSAPAATPSTAAASSTAATEEAIPSADVAKTGADIEQIEESPTMPS